MEVVYRCYPAKNLGLISGHPADPAARLPPPRHMLPHLLTLTRAAVPGLTLIHPDCHLLGKKNSLCIFRSYVCCAKRVQFATYKSENDPMIVEQQMLKQQVLLTLTILLDSAGLSLENRSVCLMLLGSLLKIDQ